VTSTNYDAPSIAIFFHPSVTFPFLGPDVLLSIHDSSLKFLHTELSNHLLNNNI